MGVQLSILGSYVKVGGSPPTALHKKIDGIMQYKPKGVQFSKMVKEDKWDGIVRLYRNREFPVGLLSRVLTLLMIEGIEYEIEDTRKVYGKVSISTGIKLRDYQIPIVEKAIEARSCLIPVATGGGKTLIAAEIIARLGQPKALYLVPSIEILTQTAVVLDKWLCTKIGLVGGGKEIHPETNPDAPWWDQERITLMTWQTVHAGLKKDPNKWRKILGEYSVLVADEVHQYGADEIFNVAMFLDTPYRFGMSGSMFRTDGQELKFYGAFGDCIEGVTASELIDRGYLVPPTIKYIATPRMLFGRRETWQDVYRVGVVENEERNQLVVDEARKMANSGRRTLIMVSHIRHGNILKHKLDADPPNYRYDFVHSQANERRDLVDDFRSGKIRLLIATPIFDMGIDLPQLEGIVLAGAGKSQVKAVQRVGRGLRIAEGKKDVQIVDFNDIAKYLFEHSKERAQIFRREPRFKLTGDVPK